jgi:transposase
MQQRPAKVTPYGTFPNTAAALQKLVKRLQQAGGGPLKFCYEAGPCGYGIHRTLPSWAKTAWLSRRR